MILRHTLTVTPLGDLTLVARDSDLVGVYFQDHRPAPEPEALGIWVSPADSTLSDAADQIHEYLAGERTEFTIPYAIPDAGFYADIWKYLPTIPYGEVTTNSKIAKALGRPRAYRAVGTGVGHNPLSLVVPCHRVIAADGSLSGYAGGVDRKRKILQMEYRVARDRGLGSHQPNLFTQM